MIGHSSRPEQTVRDLRWIAIVRLIVVLVVLAMLAPAASACPPLEICTEAQLAMLDDARSDARAQALVELVRTRSADNDEEVPWIWKVLKQQVYSRMPTYEKPNELKLVLSPVVVTSPTDTIPGVGIAGDF